MKKIIVSLLFFSCCFFLSSCNKNTSFIFHYNNNIINDDLILTVYTKDKESVYLDKKNINLVFIKDIREEVNILLNVESIDCIDKRDGFYVFEVVLDLSNIKNDLVIIEKGYIIFEYVNEKKLKMDIKDFCFINVITSEDIIFSSLKANVNNGVLESINFDLKNNTNEIIEILDILLINAKFAPYSIKSIKDNKILDKESVNSYEIKIKEYESTEVVDTAFLIKYIHLGIVKYKAVSNYSFIKNKEVLDEVYYVTD